MPQSTKLTAAELSCGHHTYITECSLIGQNAVDYSKPFVFEVAYCGISGSSGMIENEQPWLKTSPS